jgi:hypothetical protein
MKHILGCFILLSSLGLLVVSCGTDGGGTGERPNMVLNGIPFGATCASDADCGGAADSCCKGGKCSAAGWCSPKCASDQNCPQGFFCISDEGSRCFLACADDRDCPFGFLCESKDNHLTCRSK